VEDILELKADPVEQNSTKNGYIMLAEWKTLDTQNNSLTIDLSKDEDLDDR